MMKSRTYPGKNKTMKYTRKISQKKSKLVCSIKKVNLWKTVLIILVYIY